MAANLTIGKVGLDIDLAHPTDIRESSDGQDGSVSIRGYIKDTTTMEEAKHLRTQLLGQVRSNRHSGLVAVDCVVDPAINGFYYLESANIEISRRAGSLWTTGHFPYNISLRKVNTSAFSVGLTGGVMTNDHGDTSGLPLVAAPQGALSYTPEAGGTVARGGIDGTIDVFVGVDEDDTPIYELDPATPLDYYEGGCKILVAKDAGTRRLISAYDLGEMNDGQDWEIHNSLIRVEPFSSGGSAGVTVSMAESAVSGWNSSVDFIVGSSSDPPPWPMPPVIVRNDPEQATIRVTSRRSGNQIGRWALDVTVRRGQRFAHMLLHSSVSDLKNIQLNPSGSVTAVSDWGMRETNNDGQGNRWVAGSKAGNTVTTLTGLLQVDSNTQSFDFFIGYEVDGSSAQTNDTAQDIYEQYLHHLTEQVIPIIPTGVLPA